MFKRIKIDVMEILFLFSIKFNKSAFTNTFHSVKPNSADSCSATVTVLDRSSQVLDDSFCAEHISVIYMLFRSI